MKEELPKKMLFIQAQEWYNSKICSECAEFNLFPLPNGVIAFCNLMENDEICPHKSDVLDMKKKQSTVSSISELESIPQIEVIPA
jgi:hypothetical protein